MKNKVTRLLILSACALVSAMFPAGAVTIPTCEDGTLAFYISTVNLTGCQIGDKIFSNFSYGGNTAFGGGSAPIAANIDVTTIGPAGTGADIASAQFPNNIGLNFEGAWDAPLPGSTADGDISFTVSVVGGGPLKIEDAGLVQTSGPVLGTGSEAAVGEVVCVGSNCSTTVNTLQQGGGTASLSNDQAFTPTGSVSVSKDITVIAGSANGSQAFLSNVQDTFSQTTVPEPRTISFLLGCALVAGLVVRKRFQSVQS